MNYIITGGTGFIGTHLTNLIKTLHPQAKVYNLDIVKPGTPLPTVKDYKPALCEGQFLQSEFIYCDVRKPIEVPFEVTSEDVIFNFAAVHRTPGTLTVSILKQIFAVQRMFVHLPRNII